MTATATVSMIRRLAAIAALVTLGLAVALVLLAAIDKWQVVVFGTLALALSVVASWYVITRLGRARLIAAGCAVAGLVIFVIVVTASESVRLLIAPLLFGALSVACARYALATDHSTITPHIAARPTHPVLIMNLKSGGGKAERFELARRCRELGIEPIVLKPGDDLLQLAEDAVTRGADVIGMAGGDGSQAMVATVASKHGVPHVVIPAGTRNHFALDLGLDRDDVVGALDAYRDGIDVLIDLAELNGRTFVNNASLGVYAKVVQSAEYRDAKIQTAATVLPDVLGPDATPMDLRHRLPSGEDATTAQLILVSNNPYELRHLSGMGTRARMDTGQLGIVSLYVSGPADVERLAGLAAVGQVNHFAGWREWQSSSFEVMSNQPLEVGVDGEALLLDPPLRFDIRPGALTVRLPINASRRPLTVRVTSGATVKALWRLTIGRPGEAL